ncbi:phenylacetate--CoA ligase family protein [Halalkalibacter krulwichiae]|uniref:phenylacetate--CoA ligase family protein n=1 Tax=Halalkalibacter krulwichiae TaxID=199441 RepID=UPI000A504EE8|nr:AMP-binding protein [Halalkalibacter krulwichiae]
MTEMLYGVREGEVNLERYQLQELNQLLVFAAQFNDFYKEKLAHVSLPIQSNEDLLEVPFTLKSELSKDQIDFAPYGRNHSYPESSYIRYHQTSGTSGRPLKILDTKESWEWWSDCWVKVLESSGVTKEDRLYLAFSFGPFVGFWSAYEGAKKVGTTVFPGGGQSTIERLNSIIENKATVLLCTPSYALHLAEVASANNIDIKNAHIETIITAGEPGGSIPSVREHIERLWSAKLYDHVGMTEMGAYGYSCSEQKGIHVNEEHFICEVIDPQTSLPVAEGERGELVLTNLKRYGYPLIRYRTGDIVINTNTKCPCGNSHKHLPGGIIGRADDMVVIRGINIFPQSIEAIVREFNEVTEFSIVYYTIEEMDQIKVKVETENEGIKDDLQKRLRDRVGLRVQVDVVENGSLPRFEMKAKRVVDERVK